MTTSVGAKAGSTGPTASAGEASVTIPSASTPKSESSRRTRIKARVRLDPESCRGPNALERGRGEPWDEDERLAHVPKTLLLQLIAECSRNRIGHSRSLDHHEHAFHLALRGERQHRSQSEARAPAPHAHEATLSESSRDFHLAACAVSPPWPPTSLHGNDSRVTSLSETTRLTLPGRTLRHRDPSRRPPCASAVAFSPRHRRLREAPEAGPPLVRRPPVRAFGADGALGRLSGEAHEQLCEKQQRHGLGDRHSPRAG